MIPKNASTQFNKKTVFTKDEASTRRAGKDYRPGNTIIKQKKYEILQETKQGILLKNMKRKEAAKNKRLEEQKIKEEKNLKEAEEEKINKKKEALNTCVKQVKRTLSLATAVEEVHKILSSNTDGNEVLAEVKQLLKKEINNNNKAISEHVNALKLLLGSYKMNNKKTGTVPDNNRKKIDVIVNRLTAGDNKASYFKSLKTELSQTSLKFGDRQLPSDLIPAEINLIGNCCDQISAALGRQNDLKQEKTNLDIITAIFQENDKAAIKVSVIQPNQNANNHNPNKQPSSSLDNIKYTNFTAACQEKELDKETIETAWGSEHVQNQITDIKEDIKDKGVYDEITDPASLEKAVKVVKEEFVDTMVIDLDLGGDDDDSENITIQANTIFTPEVINQILINNEIVKKLVALNENDSDVNQQQQEVIKSTYISLAGKNELPENLIPEILEKFNAIDEWEDEKNPLIEEEEADSQAEVIQNNNNGLPSNQLNLKNQQGGGDPFDSDQPQNLENLQLKASQISQNLSPNSQISNKSYSLLKQKESEKNKQFSKSQSQFQFFPSNKNNNEFDQNLLSSQIKSDKIEKQLKQKKSQKQIQQQQQIQSQVNNFGAAFQINTQINQPDLAKINQKELKKAMEKAKAGDPVTIEQVKLILEKNKGKYPYQVLNLEKTDLSKAKDWLHGILTEKDSAPNLRGIILEGCTKHPDGLLVNLAKFVELANGRVKKGLETAKNKLTYADEHPVVINLGPENKIPVGADFDAFKKALNKALNDNLANKEYRTSKYWIGPHIVVTPNKEQIEVLRDISMTIPRKDGSTKTRTIREEELRQYQNEQRGITKQYLVSLPRPKNSAEYFGKLHLANLLPEKGSEIALSQSILDQLLKSKLKPSKSKELNANDNLDGKVESESESAKLHREIMEMLLKEGVNEEALKNLLKKHDDLIVQEKKAKLVASQQQQQQQQ